MTTTKPQHPTHQALLLAASILDCDIHTINAIATVEAGPNGAFLPSGEPVILFEPHWFSRYTKGKYDWRKVPVQEGDREPSNARWRVISRPVWTPGTYGPVSVQHRRLQYASTLNREAALMSASWGLYQVMGGNYKRAGHLTLQSFINAAYRSANDHLLMMVSYILFDPVLRAAVKDRKWSVVAEKYNGPGQITYYAHKLKVAYEISTVMDTEQA